MKSNTTYFSNEEMIKFMNNRNWYYSNPIFGWMCGFFSSIDIFKYLFDIYRRYMIGITHDNGVIYWQCDYWGRCNTGKTEWHDSNGKVVANSTRYFKASPHNELTCYPFGLHLLSSHPLDMTVAVVKSETSALMGATYNVIHLRNDTKLPLFIACGSTSLIDTLKHLENRHVVLFPDDADTEEWTCIAQQYSHLHRSIEVNDTVRNCVNANLIPKGSDYSSLMAYMRMETLLIGKRREERGEMKEEREIEN